jgi:glycogen debranching enzyme
MLRHMAPSPAQLREAYDKLSLQTRWWLEFRDRDHNGLCEYDHGNDSGWDNATAFRFPPPVELPDLQTFLVLQMETLADLARRLGRDGESAEWLDRSRALLARLCERCFTPDGRPLARKAFSDETDEPDCLLLFLPVLLGDRLPAPLRESLVRELASDRFLTEWGFATESPRSPHYTPDGYWLGPIWAPVMLLLIDGLRACGEDAFARDVEDRFLRLFVQSGSAEHFDALTGRGLRDPAYTWASAVFLTLLGDRAP